MVKFEGYAGLKLDWLITQLGSDLKIEWSTAKKLFVEALFQGAEYDGLRDAMAEALVKSTAEQSVAEVVPSKGSEGWDNE